MRQLASMGLLAVLGAGVCPAGEISLAEMVPIGRQLGVRLHVRQRPAWPKPPGDSVTVRLVPQIETPATAVVSLGLPLGPGWVADPRRLRVLEGNGTEVPVFTRPLAHWWIDGRQGAPRSVLVQFEREFKDATPQAVTITWNTRRTRSRPREVPIAQTQFTQHVPVRPVTYARYADPYDFQCPKVLAVLPAEWLCASGVAFQQTPAAANRAAPWFDRKIAEKFERSRQDIHSKRYEAYLFDRPATYAKIYVRYGTPAALLATRQAGDAYIRHLTDDGFLDLKARKDLKYTYGEGPALLYLLTGDPRYRDVVQRARKAWDGHKAIEYRGKGFWTERHHGFGMLAYLSAYSLTGQARWLAKAKRYFEAALSLQIRPVDGKPPDGAWVHDAASTGDGDGDGWTTCVWTSNILANAIWQYWMVSGDPRAPMSLAMYCKFVSRYAVTADGKQLYAYANSPGRGRRYRPEGGHHVTEGAYFLAMGTFLSGGRDETLRAKIAPLVPALMADEDNVPFRKFNWRFRGTPMLVWFLGNAAAPRQGIQPRSLR